MNRSKLEIIIADEKDASGQRLVELLFELSWLKHEFLAGLTSHLSPEVVPLARQRAVARGSAQLPGSSW
jgi:hypothetical protein